MSSKYITSYTPVDYAIYPPYLNISFVDEDTIRVTVRQAPNEYTPGQSAYVDIPRDTAVGTTFYEFEEAIRRD